MGDKNDEKNKDADNLKVDIDDLLIKRCPECFVSLPLDARDCFSCHSKVGNIDKHGKARRRVDWISYVVCIISWAILICYVQWAFLS